jgi:conjugative relaxase-like TrwC/TraI family protein
MMTVHVLHAGDGYSYLTRQVAAGDHTVRRGEDLTDYYTAEGNPPGVWVGEGREALGVDGDVSEAQMRALFGEGLHPDAEALIAKNVAAGMSAEDAIQATRLGRKFPSLQGKDDSWNTEISAAYEAFKTENGRLPEVGVEREFIRWTVASDRLRVQHQRDATDAEITGFLARMGKAPRQPVAGYDLVFTPVKSVSVLWALGDKDTSQAVLEAHNAAWKGTLAWLEREAALTRTGAGGVSQENTNGLIATAFEHHDSRTGDPNLHTHVAVSTKVQGLDGKWRSLDGRVLHSLGVNASERYNTLIEKELRDRLGVTFEDEKRGRNKRVVREISGVPRNLRDAFSSRRAAIEDAYADLVKDYVAAHGHTPPKPVQLDLAQKATLATREGKAAPMSLTKQREQWREAAASVVGRGTVDGLVDAVGKTRQLTDDEEQLAAASPAFLAEQVVTTIENDRATWRKSHIDAEALRVARSFANVRRGVDVTTLADEISAIAMQSSLSISAPDLNPVPDAMRRVDGESKFRVHGAERFTSTRILSIEDRLVQAASTPAGFTVTADTLAGTVAHLDATSKHPLNASQVELARRFASGGNRIEVGIGPAGTGKTTAMRAFARAVEADGGRVLALAPTAAASTVLAEEIDVEADTAHKLIWVHTKGTEAQRASPQYKIDAKTVLLIDEAGMASTPLLEGILDLAERHGASIRLLGDPAQLAAVESGGALRLIEKRAGAGYLDTVHRFVREDEAAATLKLRVGDVDSLNFYVDNNRTQGGLRQTMLEEIYGAWSVDRDAGKHSIMVAGTNEEVAALNARARLDLIAAGTVKARGAVLHDGNKAGVGDTIVTRQNERKLRANNGRDFVANGDLWKVMGIKGNELKVKSLRHGGVLTLPADYVESNVELGYAATINRVQGMTVDTSHILVDPQATSREQLYVAATRGREGNRMYTVVDEVLEVDAHAPDHLRTSIIDGLSTVLRREAAELSAHEQIQEALEQASSLSTLLPQYEHARTVVFDPTLLERMEKAARAALPADAADAVVTDTAWTHLAARLAQIEAQGGNPEARLAAVVEEKDLAEDSTVNSLAKVYHYRLGRDLPVTSTSKLPPWVTPLPEGDRKDSEVGLWLVDQAELVRGRIDYLVDQIETQPPAWATQLKPQPTDDAAQAQYRADLEAVVAYRDERGVTVDGSALGPARPDEDSYRAANSALERIRSSEPDPTPASNVDDAKQRILELARQHNAASERAESARPDPRRGADGVDALERLRRIVSADDNPERPDDYKPDATPRRGPRI